MQAWWFGGAILLFVLGFLGGSRKLPVLGVLALIAGVVAWLVPSVGAAVLIALFAGAAAAAHFGLGALRRKAVHVRAERGREFEPAWTALVLGYLIADPAAHAAHMGDAAGTDFGGGADIGDIGDIGGGIDGGGF